MICALCYDLLQFNYTELYPTTNVTSLKFTILCMHFASKKVLSKRWTV